MDLWLLNLYGERWFLKKITVTYKWNWLLLQALNIGMEGMKREDTFQYVFVFYNWSVCSFFEVLSHYWHCIAKPCLRFLCSLACIIPYLVWIQWHKWIEETLILRALRIFLVLFPINELYTTLTFLPVVMWSFPAFQVDAKVNNKNLRNKSNAIDHHFS